MSERSLVFGYDSAWTRHNQGAIVGALLEPGHLPVMLELPKAADFEQAWHVIQKTQEERQPVTTYIFIDQPTIVPNNSGQRPVETLVAGPISLRFGGVQPSNRGRTGMFCAEAPIWRFLAGHNLDVRKTDNVNIYETYPTLAMISFGWTTHDHRAKGRKTGSLPKYNPRNKNFLIDDWKMVCSKAMDKFKSFSLQGDHELEAARELGKPKKADQDKLDACVCLLVGLHFLSNLDHLIVGNIDHGYMVVPHSQELLDELHTRCKASNRLSEDWVRSIPGKHVLRCKSSPT